MCVPDELPVAAAMQKVYFAINATGVGLGPFECWLLLRGVKTLGVRMDRQQANAMRLAEWLVDKGLKVREWHFARKARPRACRAGRVDTTDMQHGHLLFCCRCITRGSRTTQATTCTTSRHRAQAPCCRLRRGALWSRSRSSRRAVSSPYRSASAASTRSSGMYSSTVALVLTRYK
jgi:hypothetical protein